MLCAGEEVGSYFDVLVHLKSGKRQEFSNLAKTEVGPMMQYIAARGLQAGSTGSPAGRAQQQDTDADCSDEVRYATCKEVLMHCVSCSAPQMV